MYEIFNCFQRKDSFKNWGTFKPDDFNKYPKKYGTYKKYWWGPKYYYKYGEYWTAEWVGNRMYFRYHEY